MNANPSLRASVWPAVLAAVAVTMLLASAAAGAGRAAGNLLQNGDAEAGQGVADNSVAPTPGWVTTGTFTAVKYGANGTPTAPSGGGGNLFAGGPSASVSTATQTVDVSASASPIDAGTVRATLSALLGGWESQPDAASVEALFVDASQTVLGSMTVGPVTAGDRGNKSAMLPRSRTASVPPKTRAIRVVITAERASGLYNDGYVDNVSLTLAAGASAAAHYRFGFRIADRSIGLSAGSSGSFTTSGQPDSTGDAKVSGATAKDLAVGWNYRGKRYVVKLHFTGRGTYDPAAHLLGLYLSVRSSNVPGCRVGASAHVMLNEPGDVTLIFCGKRVQFLAPSRASSWVKPG